MNRTRYADVPRSLLRLTLAGAMGVALLAAPAAAQSYTDGSFASGWSQSTYVNPYSCSGGSIGVSATGGNPGAYLDVTNHSCGFVHNGNFSPFTWNPSTQGEITSLLIGAEVNGQGPMAFLPVLRQSGSYFAKGGVTAFNPQWITLSESGLGGWCELYPAWSLNGNYACGGAQLDFTPTGSTIEFGIASANSGGRSYSQSGGIDNFDLQLTTIAPAVVATPEPASMLMLATGLIAVGAITRRRKSDGD